MVLNNMGYAIYIDRLCCYRQAVSNPEDGSAAAKKKKKMIGFALLLTADDRSSQGPYDCEYTIEGPLCKR